MVFLLTTYFSLFTDPGNAAGMRAEAFTKAGGFFQHSPIGYRGDRHAPQRSPALLKTVGHRAAESSEDVVASLVSQRS